MSATALPSRKMMLSRFGSLWLTSSPATGSGGEVGHAYGAGSKLGDSEVVGAQECRNADEGILGEGPVGVGRQHGGAGDVTEDFPAL